MDPLYACRGEFAAFVCAGMARLPQTAPGVPAAGIDPTVDELQQMGDVAGIFSWLGSEESLRTAVLRALGGVKPRLRDLVYVLADLWKDTVRNLRVPQGETERDLTALEVGDASRGHAWVSPRKSVGSCTDPALVVQGDASIGSSSLGTSLPSHGSSSRFFWTQRWTQSSRAFRRQKYRKCLPTTSVLSISSLPPTWTLLPISHSSDLMVRGCCANSMTSTGPSCLTALGNGRNCPDPLPSIFRWASFRVYRSTLLAPDAAPPKILDGGGEMVRSHSTLNDDAWFVVYNVDVRMRSEQFERLRRKAERDHAAAGTVGGVSDYDPAKPWETVFAMAVANEEWWNENLHRPAMLYLTRIMSASTAVEDGSAPPALSVAIEPGPENTRRTQACTEVPGHLWSSAFPQGQKHHVTS